jgi:hypothetical protein
MQIVIFFSMLKIKWIVRLTPKVESKSYTLQDLYNRLQTGAAGTQSPFTEPDSGPTAGTMQNINAIMGVAPVVDDTDGAVAEHVLTGKKFWGLRSGAGWGLITGTLATQTLDPDTVSQSAGYYGDFDLSVVDPDLAAGNIKKDVAIFGISGTFEGAGVPKTGQTTSYGTRDDGALQRGVAWPNPRFTDNGDGTVTDNLTSLVWLTNAHCEGTKAWDNALAFANGLANGQCGLTDGSSAGDWWLPNWNELRSLIDASQYEPALPSGHPFIGVELSKYWSSTTAPDSSDAAWLVDMGYGLVSGDDKALSQNFVWPVRAGQ